jgi:phenylpropionate dioxygenase-like ring-hydroxylating dioxygenase large terminal subunit
MNEHLAGVPNSEEVSLALRHCWQPVARVEELRHGPKLTVVLGERLAVFLTDGGEPAVVSDRCAHRGASLSMGEVRGECIRCPYHGWEWAGKDGACSRIPSLTDQRQIPRGAKISVFPARLQWGLVWACLEKPAAELPNPDWFDPEEWQWQHGPPFELPVALGLMIENFRDVAHFAFVHEATLGVVEEVVEPLEPVRDGLEVSLRRTMAPGEEAERIWGSVHEVHYQAIAPNFISVRMETTEGERAILHSARAISATESVHYWIQALSRDFEAGRLGEAIEFEERVYAEDAAVISAIDPPELPLGPSAEVSTLADAYTLAYRQAFVEFVDQALAERRSQSTSIVS